MDELHRLLQKKPYLAWYVSNKGKLSEESVVEHILNYGNWDDYLKVEKIIGIKRLALLFNKLKSKKRVNLRSKTINYFENYFQKYA